MDYIGLKELLDFFCTKSNMHISICDIKGILCSEALALPWKYKIHSKHFCDIAKSTQKGYNLCIQCKTLANAKAITDRKDFWGTCPYGLAEYAKPVMINNEVACIIYIGNFVLNKKESLARLHRTAKLTGVNSKRLAYELESAEYLPYTDVRQKTAEVIDSYIRLLESETDKVSYGGQDSGCQWKITEIIQYINMNYKKNISIKQLATLYFMNEKYLGRLFKAKTGCSVHQYLNQIRIDHALENLKTTKQPILEIALNCGFQNVTYFNRQFSKMYHITPSAYRKKSLDGQIGQ